MWSTCVASCSALRHSGLTVNVSNMNGDGSDLNTSWFADSASIDGANGRQSSLCLTFRLMRSFIPGIDGLARMLRLPRARGPISSLP